VLQAAATAPCVFTAAWVRNSAGERLGLSFTGDSSSLQKFTVRKVYVIVNPYGGLQKGLRILDEDVLPVFNEHVSEG
jgi:hypothetical protein